MSLCNIAGGRPSPNICFSDTYLSRPKTLFSALPLLNLSRHPLEEAGMFIWILIGAMAVVGGIWVKTRRQRKSKAPSYAGGN